MGVITLLLLIVVLIFVFQLNSKISNLDDKVDRLLKQPFVTKQEATSHVTQPKPAEASTPADKKPPVQDTKPDTIITPAPQPKQEEIKQAPPSIHKEAVPSIKKVENTKPITPPATPKPKKPSFMERNPDLEKFIGENLLSKIGIVIFVIGMGFLVKLGIDNNVITESMRVAIGVIIGGGMVGLAHYLRKSFATFSSVLIGGALAVLYFTIALAFHEYALIPQTAAFVIMVLITAFGVLLSIAYDRKVLAILAMIGGFGTPFFLSTGEGNIKVLFTYILILDVGMLALVYFKKWNIINKLAYMFTYVLFLGVYVNKYIGNEELHRWTMLLSLTCFYLVFFLMNIIYNVKNNRKFQTTEIVLLLSNSAIYFGFGLGLLNSYKNGFYNGAFITLVALFNFAFLAVLQRRKDIDRNLLLLLVGLVLTFVSLIAPIQLEGNYITLFWALEAVLLLYVAEKSGLKLVKLASLLVSICMLLSLVIDWQQSYYPHGEYVVLPFFLNKVFITSIFALASLFGTTYFVKKDEFLTYKDISLNWRCAYAKVAFAAVLYLALLIELNYQFVRIDFSDTLRFILLGIYNYIYVIALTVLARLKSNVLLQKLAFLFSLMVIASYITYFLMQVTIARNAIFTGQSAGNSGFYWHYVLLLLFVWVLIDALRYVRKVYTLKSDYGKVALWSLAFIGVYVCSTEVGHISVLYQSGRGITSIEAYSVALKSVYPVVWAVSAFTLMLLGMKLRLKTLRIASLIVFLVTIIKLFVYDLAGNSTGKIISFVLLGVILLVISFLYQKLKFIIQNDDEKVD